MPSAILSTERFAGKSIQTEIRTTIDCETSATDFRATSRWCVQTAIHVRSTFQTFVERRSLYLVVFLRLLSGDRSVRLARVARNLPSENRRQGHPLLESSRSVRSVAPPQSSNASIDRTTSPDSGTRWSLRSRKSVSRNSSIIVRIRQEFVSRIDRTTSWRKESIARKVDLLVDSFHLAGNIASMNGRVHCYLRSIDRVRVGGGRRWTGSETEKEGNSQEWQCFEFF